MVFHVPSALRGAGNPMKSPTPSSVLLASMFHWFCHQLDRFKSSLCSLSALLRPLAMVQIEKSFCEYSRPREILLELFRVM